MEPLPREPRFPPNVTGRQNTSLPIHRSLGFKVRETNLYPLLLQVDQSGLFLPSRDYYLNRTANEKVRHILQLLLPSLAELANLYVLSSLPRVRVGNGRLLCYLASKQAILYSFFSPYLASLPPSLLPTLPFFLFFLPEKFFSLLLWCWESNQTSHMLGKPSTIELHPQPWEDILWVPTVCQMLWRNSEM